MGRHSGTSAFFQSRLPYQWEAGGYNRKAHSLALSKVPKIKTCGKCHHPIPLHSKGVGCTIVWCSCKCHSIS